MSKLGVAESTERLDRSDAAPYILQELISSIPIDADDGSADARITCAEFYDDNLYVGTSAAEIIHFVAIPQEPNDFSAAPIFIQASRRQVDFVEASSTRRGIEQILVLPSTGKACILCNGTLTFYSLPELSPAYGETTRVPRCFWVGGVDLDAQSIISSDDNDFFLYCDENRARLVRLGDRPKRIRDIGHGGCIAVQRRGPIACVADSRSYALLEVALQQVRPLFEICPQSDQTEKTSVTDSDKPLPSLPESSSDNHIVVNDAIEDQSSDPKPNPVSEYRSEDHLVEAGPDLTASSERKRGLKSIKPNIVSPTPSEFLLTTGTSPNDEGVGIFINLDGDVIRGTLQFSRYPEALVVDGRGVDLESSRTAEEGEEAGYVLAVVPHTDASISSKVIEIQRWDLDPSVENPKHYLDLEALQRSENPKDRDCLGLRKTASRKQLSSPAVVEKLSLKRARVRSRRDKEVSVSDATDAEDRAREKSETQFISQIGTLPAEILLWTRDSIYWTFRTPLVLRLDSRLDSALDTTSDVNTRLIARAEVETVLNDLNGSDAQNELDFMTLKYIRQKASLMLFLDLLMQTFSDSQLSDRDRQVTEEALTQAETDPRVLLAAIPVLRDDIFGASRLWMQGGLVAVLDVYFSNSTVSAQREPSLSLVSGILPLAKNFLQNWRRKKGFGSIADEEDVFKSIDAALLHLLLILDSPPYAGVQVTSSIRSELNTLVDGGVDCFEYAIELCENHNRLYILSRLYQSKKQVSMVLSTWRRIMEGELDRGGKMINGEEVIKNYLRQRKRPLVEEYGTWLAQRNPDIGVQVFADPESQTKFQPKEVVELLKRKAPKAVKSFLEHLVFGNNLPQYANDLVGYYLDSVIAELDSSTQSRELLLDSYETYRALTPPKPTYSQFVTNNSLDAEWWRNRLRLLQLLGGSHGAASQYDISGITTRIENYSDFLVPETIILSGRQGRHRLAIEMLTHRLGDFDTAISYCVLGGSSTYSPSSGKARGDSMPTQAAQAELFNHLLSEFFKIEDPEERISQASELLERFSGWFDLEQVLSQVPVDWSVSRLSGFLESSARKLVSDRHETVITRALVSGCNMTTSVTLIEKLETLGSKVAQELEQAG